MINIIFIIIGTLGLLIPIFTIFVLINELYTRKTMSKKNIKDYLGKKYAVVCKTKEDWDKLVKLTNCNNPNYFERSVSKCFDLWDVGTYWGTSNIKEIESVYGREIIPASDFLEEGKSSDSLKIEDLVEGKVYKFYFSENKSGIISKYNSSTFQTSKNIGPYIMFDTYYNKEHLSVTLPKLEIKNITEDELKWYNVCVSRDCFVNKEEALKVVEKPQFELNKWYKVRYENSKDYYTFNVKEVTSDNVIICSGYIYENRWRNSKDCRLINISSCQEIKQLKVEDSEIQQYLPEDHEDKIVEKKELSKDELLEKAKKDYPIGSKIKTTRGNVRTIRGEIKWNINEIVATDSDEKTGFYPTLYNNISWAEIISLPESKTEVMEEFKVGDNVKLKPNSKGGGQHVVGNIYKIVSDDTKPKYGLEGIDKSGHLKVWYYHPEDLKLWSTPIPTTSNSSELSSLPDDWFVVINKENNTFLTQWENPSNKRENYFVIGAAVGLYKGNKQSKGIGFWEKNQYPGWKEITFDQFKKWVLKETPKQSTTNIMIDKMNDEIPEYVECIKATRNTVWYSDSIGKIFKVVGIYKDNNFYIEHQGKTDTYLMSFDDCIRSSLSAYEAQFTKSAKSLDLVEGTWYKIKAFEDQYEYWVNYKKDWKSCNHIYNKTYYGSGSFVKVSVICELSPDEYEQYLPKTKVDETKTIKNEETMDFIWYRRTNSNLLSCDTKNNRLEVAWKVNKSTKHGVLSILANGETSSYVTMPPLSNLVTCTEEEANSYFKELIDVPRDKSSSNKSIKVGDNLQDLNILEGYFEAYYSPEGKKYGSSYYLKNKDKTVLDIKNGYVQVSGFSLAGWFKMSDLGYFYHHEEIAKSESTSSEITWEELLRSDGRWVNFDLNDNLSRKGKAIIAVADGKVYILSNESNFNGCPPVNGKRGYKNSWLLDSSKSAVNSYSKIIKSWASGPDNLTTGTNSSNYITVDTTISPIYSVGVDPYYEDRRYDVCVKFKEEEPKLFNEKEFLSKPFNQELTIKTKKKDKKAVKF